MPSGGTRTRSGPTPDPSALRRDRDEGEWITLPAQGRAGRTPVWPLSPTASRRESVVWRRLWRRPQAVMWERERLEDQVAFYVRTFVEAEARDVQANRRTLLRQWADDLGLTNAGAARLRWRIAPDQVRAKRSERAVPKPPARSSARSRLKVVKSAAGEG